MELYDIEALSELGICTDEFSSFADYCGALSQMDAQVSVGISDGCGFCLVITEEYSPFITYPRPICDDFDLGAAVGAAYAFCLDSEIPVRVIDIPTDELPRLLRGVRHADVDGDGEYFNVSVKTECMLTEVLPEYLMEDVYLGELVYKFAEDYKRLVTDEVHNKYSGEDVRFDMKDEDAEFFIDEARAEFEMGTSMTFAATVLSEAGDNVFIGEGVLYRFDGKGECEAAVRILPEFCGKGYSKKILAALIAVCGELGLSSVVARIHKDNERAHHLASSLMEKVGDEGEIVTYRAEGMRGEQLAQ